MSLRRVENIKKLFLLNQKRSEENWHRKSFPHHKKLSNKIFLWENFHQFCGGEISISFFHSLCVGASIVGRYQCGFNMFTLKIKI
jgi:hypothetical protein